MCRIYALVYVYMCACVCIYLHVCVCLCVHMCVHMFYMFVCVQTPNVYNIE